MSQEHSKQSTQEIIDLNSKIMNMFISELASKYKIDRKDLKSKYESIKTSTFASFELRSSESASSEPEQVNSSLADPVIDKHASSDASNIESNTQCVALKKDGERCMKKHVSHVHNMCSTHAKMAMKNQSSVQQASSSNQEEPVRNDEKDISKSQGTSSICSAVKKSGDRCKNKAKNDGVCALHAKKNKDSHPEEQAAQQALEQAVKPTVGETKQEDESAPENKIFIVTNIFLGLKWDRKNRYVMLKDTHGDDKIYRVIGVFRTKLEHLTPEDILKVRELYKDKPNIVLHENHSEINFSELKPQFPEKMKEEFSGEISPEYIA